MKLSATRKVRNLTPRWSWTLFPAVWGRTTVEVENLCKAYGDKVLIRDFTYIFLKNDRVGIIGPNGSGKST